MISLSGLVREAVSWILHCLYVCTWEFSFNHIVLNLWQVTLGMGGISWQENILRLRGRRSNGRPPGLNPARSSDPLETCTYCTYGTLSELIWIMFTLQILFMNTNAKHVPNSYEDLLLKRSPLSGAPTCHAWNCFDVSSREMFFVIHSLGKCMKNDNNKKHGSFSPLFFIKSLIHPIS